MLVHASENTSRFNGCGPKHLTPMTMTLSNPQPGPRRLGPTKQPVCPVCRKSYVAADIQQAKDVANVIATKKAPCSGCSQLIPLAHMNAHTSQCVGNATKSPKFKPVAETSQPVPRELPNRSTFRCPYCSQSNLDVESLRQHCTEKHRRSPDKVVCPVCASMPWGDPTLRSANFLSHLNLRHKFEYDTYVDYTQDDDTMLMEVIKASLESN
ncbi:RING-type E3 ubiquitin transferase [Lamellibrachia satsuma]|nr:RING-type E3 ubiquitin transferase [Lamellibrachia satsuma]